MNDSRVAMRHCETWQIFGFTREKTQVLLHRPGYSAN